MGDDEPGLQIGARWRGIGTKGATVDDIAVFDRELSPLEILQLGAPERFQELCNKPASALTADERALFKGYYHHQISTQYKSHLAGLEKLRAGYNATMDTVREVMIIREMEKPRPAFILQRGQYDLH